MAALQELASVPRTPVDYEFDALPADAGEDTRQQLAERFAPVVRRQYQDHPSLKDAGARAPQGEAVTRSVVVQGLVEFYNPAQLDVLRRANALIEANPTPSERRPDPI